ncbi:MAG: sigma-70 family RNA polymerase sigma factor [Candidatus Omnitrophica bacterium]|nr:sigma-70 family RNA polymerase sigma factor [Candidatus Omnitrophota bacterium]
MNRLTFDIGKLKQHDESEWTRVYDECATAVFNFLMRRNGNRREVAKDLTQQAFLQALQSIERFDERRSNFLAWLIGIAKRDSAYYGHEKREIATADVEAMREGSGDAPLEPLGPREELARLQEDEFLEAILGTMPEQQERALRLRYLDGLSHREIGERLHLSEKAAEVTVRRGRKKLQEAFFELHPFLTRQNPVPQEVVG